MADVSERIRAEIEALKTMRDELRVQTNLGAKEARDAWHEAERKWQEIEGKMEDLGRASAESGREISAALGMLADAVRNAYTNLKQTL